MSRENRVGVRSLDAQLKKIADKLHHLSSSPSIAETRQPQSEFTRRELWEVWEMLRILTLRIRDLEAQQAAKKAAVQS